MPIAPRDVWSKSDATAGDNKHQPLWFRSFLKSLHAQGPCSSRAISPCRCDVQVEFGPKRSGLEEVVL